MLFSLEEILAATGGRAEGVAAEGVTSISIDSRAVAPGALFVAIAGERFDGHDFAAEAVARGAAVALVSEARAEGLAGLPLVVAADALEGLNALARAARARTAAGIVAVTGSVGKTTTKEMLRAVLSAAGTTHAAEKSFNNQWGVPLTLARLPADARFGVFEIGMNHAGEIAPLSEMVRPHVAMVTMVAPAHLAYFPSIEAIAMAKAEIFGGVVPGGAAVLNADHAHVELLAAAAGEAGISRIATYGFSESAQVRVTDYAPDGQGARARVLLDGALREVTLATPGRHMMANAAGALAAAEVLGVAPEAAIAALAALPAPAGRGAVIELGTPENGLRLIDESYNANPVSMAAALENFAALAARGRKVLVLGDMLELGAESATLHRALGDTVRATGADLVFLVGPEMAALGQALGPGGVAGHADTARGLAGEVLDSLANGDVVMVKGSNGLRLGDLVALIRERFAGGEQSAGSSV